MLLPIGLLLLSYCIGSIPIGYLIARLRGIRDIRGHGSGSTGATNVSRVLGWPYFILVFLIDFLKAVGVMAVGVFLFPHSFMIMAMALLLLLGNGFPIFLTFRGGKGVATTLGILVVVQPLVLVFLVPLWLGVYVLTTIVGVASSATLAVLPVAMYVASYDYRQVLLGICISGLVLYYHRMNLRQLFSK